MSWINKYCMYYDIIFPLFHLFDPSLQIHHLRFIKKEIYPSCLLPTTSDYHKVKQFVEAFQSLKFIPDNSGDLQVINSFYDGCSELFELFCEKSFLLDHFRDKEWHDFFEFFGLKISPTVEEFKSYCKKLREFSDISKIKRASSVLLTALFASPVQGDNKCEELQSSDCTKVISQIPIAVVESFPDLDCIAVQKMGEIKIDCGSSTISLAKLSDASVVDNKYLLWTIKPLIVLPSVSDSYKLNVNVLEDCGVVQVPSEEEVILNLLNVSSACSTESSGLLFVAHEGDCLPKVVVTMLEFLQVKARENCIVLKHASKELKYSELVNANFVPVKLPKGYALAKPSQILHIDPSHAAPFYPFLHPVIEETYGVIEFLAGLGVEKSITFSHIQHVLQSAKNKCDDNKVDENIRGVVVEATGALIKLLEHKDDDTKVAQSLQPLYLLSLESKLVESSRLIVNDIAVMHEILPPFGYSFLNPLKNDRKMAIKQLVDHLPKQLGLKSLKSMLEYEIIDDTEEKAEYVFPHVSGIENILRSNEFKIGIELLACCYTDGITPSSVTEILENFQTNFVVQYFNKLQIRANVKLDNTVIPMGNTIDDWFLLQHTVDQQQWILSLKNTPDNYPYHILSNLTSQLCSKLKLKSEICFQTADSDLPDLILFIYHMLQCPSHLEILQVIRQNIPDFYNSASCMSTASNKQPTLGDAIAECWYNKISKSEINEFESQEWVGYEDPNGSIVYAQILHEIDIQEDDHDVVNEGLEPKFLITTGKEEPIEVDNSELYKIPKNKMPSNHEASKLNIPISQKNPDEAKRWMKQAEHDYAALCALKNATKCDEKVSAATCFMSHEVAERCLKAGMYAISGQVNLLGHDLVVPAYELVKYGCSDVIKEDVEFLQRFYLDTRYPNRYHPPTVPGERFVNDTAKQAFEAAARIYKLMLQVIEDET